MDTRRPNQFEWKSLEQTLSNVRETVSDHFGLPNDVERGDPEWQIARQKLCDPNLMNGRILVSDLGLGAAYISNEWFSSWIDLVIAAFPAYDLAEILNGRRHHAEYTWATREETLLNVEKKVSEMLNLPASPPPRDSDAWFELRQRILSVNSDRLKGWGLRTSFAGNNFFDSYIDLLIEIFDPHYSVASSLNQRRNPQSYLWARKSKEEIAGLVRSIIMSDLGVAEIIETEGTRARAAIKREILKLRRADFTRLGIQGAASHSEHFYSYRDVLIAAFSDYEIEEAFRALKHQIRFRWRTREETCSNVRETLGEELGLILNDYNPESADFKIARARLVSIQKKEMHKRWHLASSYTTNKFFNSHIDVLIASFPEFGLDRMDFSRNCVSLYQIIAKLAEINRVTQQL